MRSMSARCTSAVFERYPVGGGEFTLAIALADNAHDDGTHIYPYVETMARKSRQDVRTVQRHLKRMLESGWLILVRPAGGRGRPAEYRISPRWLKGDSLSPISDAAQAPECTEKGDNVSPIQPEKRVTSEAQKGDIQNTPYKNQKNLYTPLPPKGGGAADESRGEEAEPDGFKALVAAYPAHRVNLSAALRQWRRFNPSLAQQATMVAAAAAQAKTAEWMRDEGRPVPNLSKWIRNRAWRAYEPKPPSPTSAPQSPVDTRSLEQREADRQRAIEARAKLASMTRRREAVPA
jgi:hypothetical protein